MRNHPAWKLGLSVIFGMTLFWLGLTGASSALVRLAVSP